MADSSAAPVETAGQDPAAPAATPDAPATPDASTQPAPNTAAAPAPYLSSAGTSTIAVTPSLAGAGLRINGGTEPASYALATYQVNTGAMRATAEFTVSPAAGAAFTYALTGSGGGYSSRNLRLQRVPGSDQLQAVSTTGAVNCGHLPAGQPTQVTLSFDGAAHTFDVLLNGAQTPCTDLVTRVSGPAVGFRVSDETIAGYGGRVDFSNLTLFGAP